MSPSPALPLCPLCSAVLKIGFSIRLAAPCPPSSPSLLPLPSPAVFLKTQVFVERESERRGVAAVAAILIRRKPLIEEGEEDGRENGGKEGRKDSRKRCSFQRRFDFSLLPNKKTKTHLFLVLVSKAANQMRTSICANQETVSNYVEGILVLRTCTNQSRAQGYQCRTEVRISRNPYLHMSFLEC